MWRGLKALATLAGHYVFRGIGLANRSLAIRRGDNQWPPTARASYLLARQVGLSHELLTALARNWDAHEWTLRPEKAKMPLMENSKELPTECLFSCYHNLSALGREERYQFCERAARFTVVLQAAKLLAKPERPAISRVHGPFVNDFGQQGKKKVARTLAACENSFKFW
jgi:hypothetical protein